MTNSNTTQLKSSLFIIREFAENIHSKLSTKVENAVEMLESIVAFKDGKPFIINDQAETIRQLSFNVAVYNVLHSDCPKIALEIINMFKIGDLLEIESEILCLKNRAL